MVSKVSRAKVRTKKHDRMRNRFSGTAERPRLAVFRSNNHIYAQIIDDVTGKSLFCGENSQIFPGYCKSFVPSVRALRALSEALLKGMVSMARAICDMEDIIPNWKDGILSKKYDGNKNGRFGVQSL